MQMCCNYHLLDVLTVDIFVYRANCQTTGIIKDSVRFMLDAHSFHFPVFTFCVSV